MTLRELENLRNKYLKKLDSEDSPDIMESVDAFEIIVKLCDMNINNQWFNEE